MIETRAIFNSIAFSRRLTVILLLACCSGSAAFAQAYPARPVSFILPVPPGGALDIFARTLNQSFTARVGQPLLIEWVKQQSGLEMTFVRYKGQQDANKDFLGGRLHLYYPAIGNTGIPQDVNSGKITGLIVAGNKRVGLIPNVPTFVEMGLPDFDVRSWLGAFMPTGVPREAATRIAADFTAIIRSPEFIEKYLVRGGFEPLGGTPDEFAAFLREDKKVGAVMAKLAVRPE
ncbi:MAG: Bug family tripartite tricarboxylate transporter substrate binding protein [Burkholderiales bacterium]